MKWQTNDPLGPFINNWGCFFHSDLEKVEKTLNWQHRFTNEQILEIYHYGMSHTFRYADGTTKPWISPEVYSGGGIPLDGCFIWNAPGIFNIGAEMLGSKARCAKYSGCISAKYLPKRNEEELLCLERHGYDGSHFVAGTNKPGIPWQNEIEFDPIEGGSNCARLGWIDSKRILTIEGAS